MATVSNNEADSLKDILTSGISPRDVRLAIRSGDYYGSSTIGICEGYIQANLAILPSVYSKDFLQFCKANQGALPLLFQSEPGQVTAPPLSLSDSDIRTDVTAYTVWKNGEKVKVVSDLLEFDDVFKDYSTSYLGCSFSFERVLVSAGISNVQNGNVSMYETNIACHSVGPFACNMIVSVRPIARHLVETAFKVTSPFINVHGAPVHVGNPAIIGIQNLAELDFGDVMKFKDGDVPVFWCCGVTGAAAIKALKIPLGFSHSPGCMFICDSPLQSVDMNTIPDHEDPCVIELSADPFYASVASQSTICKISQLEDIIISDPGSRGVKHLQVKNDLMKTALSLSHASSVAIITGFPCMLNTPCVLENDGPLGAIAIAVMLQNLGIDVSFIADRKSNIDGIMENVIEKMLKQGALHKSVPVISFPSAMDNSSAAQFLTQDDGVTPRFDHLLAIERTGLARDGSYYTMKGRDISDNVDNITVLFEVAHLMAGVKTTGIGDGGNELGMGKMLLATQQHIPLGDKIACTTVTDYLIVAGVSNWGGYALSAALALLRTCSIHDRYQRRACGFPLPRKEIFKHLPQIDMERKRLELIVEMGLYDGILGEKALSVDGFNFDGVHSNVIKDILDVVSA